MGLGKTIQISSFLSGLFASDLAKRVLILMPVSVIENWKVRSKKNFHNENIENLIVFILLSFSRLSWQSGRRVFV